MKQSAQVKNYSDKKSENTIAEDNRVLIVDDEKNILNLLAQVLESDGYEPIKATSGEQALTILKSTPVPLVLADVRLSGMSGFDLLRETKHLNKNTQVIIITSHASTESAMESMRYDAYDYILKPFDNLEIVSNAVKRAQEKFSLLIQNEKLISELKQKNADLEEINLALKEKATRDGLTGLHNHRYFQESLQIELARSKRYKKTFSVVFMDLDNFKLYNDSYGHINGDKLLIDVAKILTSNLRKCDTVARYGGEEFIFLLPETSTDDAVNYAENIRLAIENFNFGKTVPAVTTTVSIGLASFPEHGKIATQIIELADKALYEAKNTGKNKVCTAKPEDTVN